MSLLNDAAQVSSYLTLYYDETFQFIMHEQKNCYFIKVQAILVIADWALENPM